MRKLVRDCDHVGADVFRLVGKADTRTGLCYLVQVSPDAIAAKIRQRLPDAQVELRDLTGGQDHWEAVIVSAAFVGKSMLEQHRLVFDALAEEMKGPIHALTLKTYTPDKKP